MPKQDEYIKALEEYREVAEVYYKQSKAYILFLEGVIAKRLPQYREVFVDMFKRTH